jgi:hypothetical protein
MTVYCLAVALRLMKWAPWAECRLQRASEIAHGQGYSPRRRCMGVAAADEVQCAPADKDSADAAAGYTHCAAEYRHNRLHKAVHMPCADAPGGYRLGVRSPFALEVHMLC